MIRKLLAGLMTIIILGMTMCSCEKTTGELSNDANTVDNFEYVSQNTSKWINNPISKDFHFIDADDDNDYVIQHDMVAMSG